MSLVKNTATIGGLTLVSRVLGFVRDQLMAHFVGAGFASDAFLVAWRLPNLFRALFAEGAFASAFVPMFNRVVAQAETEGREGLPAGIRFAEDVLSVLLPFLAVFTTLIMAFPRPIVWLITLGFKEGGGAAKFDLAVHLTQLTFPYLMLISLVSLLGGILNSLNRFWVNAAAPVLLNICMIAGLLFFRGHTGIDTARTQAIAVTVSGVAQLLWLIWSCRQAGVSLQIKRPTLDPQVKQLLTHHLAGRGRRGRGAVQPADLDYARRRFPWPGIGLLPLLCRSAEPVAARADRHRHRHRDPARPFAPDRRRQREGRDRHAEPRDRTVAAAHPPRHRGADGSVDPAGPRRCSRPATSRPRTRAPRRPLLPPSRWGYRPIF